MFLGRKGAYALLLIVAIAGVALSPVGAQPAQAQNAAVIGPANFYVSTTGSDANTCKTVADPCATIDAALAKAASGNWIYVAAGTYTSSNAQVVLISRTVNLLGGWNEEFTAQAGLSTIDGEGARTGVVIVAGAVSIGRFRIQNGYGPKAGAIAGAGSLQLSDSILTGNTGGVDGAQASAGAIFVDAALQVTNSTLSGNTVLSSSGGSAVYSDYDDVSIIGSTISGNSGAPALKLPYTDLQLKNSTISGNSSGGISITYKQLQDVQIGNVTITKNGALAGSGLATDAVSFVQMYNSILAGNARLDGTGADCNGRFSSVGYNVIGSNANCVISSFPGDQQGTAASPLDPRLAPLGDNGGPTMTHALMPGSPALDAGSPGVPGSSTYACRATDQRGVARPVGARCDSGAYEGVVGAVKSITRLDPNPTTATSVSFSVLFSEPVTGVDADDFTLTTTGVPGASITGVSGSGDTWTVVVSAGDGHGTLRLDLVDDDGILTGSGDPLGGTGSGNGDFTGGQTYTVLGLYVASIARLSENPTSAASMDFLVTFSEPVTGVETSEPFSDFALTTLGLTGAAITGVTGSGAQYTVAVSAGTGFGTLRLDVIDDNSIIDAEARPLGGSEAGDGNFTTGESYTIEAPYVVSSVPSDPTPTAADTLNFVVTFSRPVTGVELVEPFGDFALTTTGVSGAAITAATGSGDTYTVTVNAGTGSGTIRLDVADDNSIVDSNNAPLGGSEAGDGVFTTGVPYTINGPSVVSIVRLSVNPTNAPTVQFTVTFSEAVTGVTKVAPFPDFGLTMVGVKGATVSAVTGRGTTYTVTVKTGNGLSNGTLRLNVVDDNTIRGLRARTLGGETLGDGTFTLGQAYKIINIPVPKAPKAMTWDTTPGYQWSKVPNATQYRYQLVKGTTTVYTRTVSAASCGTACGDVPTTPLVPGAGNWRVQAYANGAWKPFSPYLGFTLYAPTAGYWAGPSDNFSVTANRVQVSKFTTVVSVSGCGVYRIWSTQLLSIGSADGHFSLSGPLWTSGAFDPALTSPTRASGDDGLNNFYISGCGYVTGGPHSWTASWRSVNAPAMPVRPQPWTAVASPALGTPLDAPLNLTSLDAFGYEQVDPQSMEGLPR